VSSLERWLHGAHTRAKNYITRNQAIKKLQISLSDFRRLCILKGKSGAGLFQLQVLRMIG